MSNSYTTGDENSAYTADYLKISSETYDPRVGNPQGDGSTKGVQDCQSCVYSTQKSYGTNFIKDYRELYCNKKVDPSQSAIGIL